MQNPPLQSPASFTHETAPNMPKKLNAEAASGFGPRLAALRKIAGITQTALAAEIQISQRMMAYYEGPTAHPPANLLPALATALGVSVDTLLGIEASKRRAKATDTRLERRLRQLEKLNAADKRQVLQLIDAFIERGQLKRKQRQPEPVSR